MVDVDNANKKATERNDDEICIIEKKEKRGLTRRGMFFNVVNVVVKLVRNNLCIQ